ncbi:MAG TPA: phosphate acyltransferase PlsX [Firmicutes bacterium]|nr:phosphate acyltransferase PlsX [Bacillota bacterium]
MKTIVVDMMGSDNGVSATIDGVQQFFSRNNGAKLILVGDPLQLAPLKDQCEIIPSTDIVPMEAGAMDVMRLKNSSMLVAINTCIERQADAIVSAGSTGGFLSATTLKLKLIPGVERAALMSPFPTAISGKKATVLDIGANNENTPTQIVQFAKMGSIFAKRIYNIDTPKIYLLSNGVEEKKGTPELKEAHQILKQLKYPGFMGNIEAREALNGEADVIVSGGFAGNIFLKGSEGILVLMNNLIKKAFKRNIFTKIGYLLSKKGFEDMKTSLNYKTYGGATLLGVDGVVVKAHGSSDGFSFSYALEVAFKMAEADVVTLIKEGLQDGANY